MSENKKLQREQLKQFEPLGELSDARLDELLSLVYTEKFAMGASLFREGDIENQTMYLLSGDVQLSSSDGRIDTVIRYREEKARHPLDDSQPRQSSCTSITPVEVLRIDNSVLDYMMMWDQMGISVELEKQKDDAEDETENRAKNEQAENDSGKTPAATDSPASEKSAAPEKASEPLTDTEQPLTADEADHENSVEQTTGESEADVVGEAIREVLSEDAENPNQPEHPAPGSVPEDVETGAPENASDDRAWIRKMSHIMAFKSMPPANIKHLLDKMEAVEVKAGESVVEQGDPGDYYYVLVDGKAKVTRTIELATLTPGRSFGEEALLSGSQRNASVTMLEDGMVMRLDKRDFDDMLREPMLNRLAPSEARLKVAQGARWLDIRHAKEFSYSRLPEAMNIPLHELRLRIEELDKDVHYICYCRTGHRSAAAAFLLVQNGFNASVLSGGAQVMGRDLV